MPSSWGWRWFGAWAGAGVLVSFSLLGALSVGLFLLPFAVVAIWAVSRASPRWTSAVGLVSGAGLTCLVVWALNRDYRPCPEEGGLTLAPGETSSECGGFDPLPWLVAGIALTLAGAVVFAVLRHRNAHPRVG